MKEIRTRTSIFRIDEYGIVHKQVIEGVNVEPEDVDEDQEMLLKLQGGKKALVLVNATVFHTMTPEAIEKLKESMAESRLATAMVSENLGVRIFVDTLSILLKKKNVFIDMFPTEKEAVKWLLSVKKEAQKPFKRLPKSKKIRTSDCELKLDNRGILHKKILHGSHVSLSSVKSSERISKKLAGNKKVLTLIDRRANYSITPEAVKRLQKNITAKYRIATALVAAKPHKLQPGNIKGAPPVKVFKDKATAVKWLLSFRKVKNKPPGRSKF